MRLQASSYAESLFASPAGGAVVSRGGLSQYESANLSSHLRSDAQKLLHCSVISISDAIRGIENKYSTWPIVKLYYATFYAVRALLALNHVCIFYIGRSGGYIEGRTGGVLGRVPDRVRASTHKMSFFLFEKYFKGSVILSQDIDNMSPFEWIMKRREEANYTLGRFVEPGRSSYLELVSKSGCRKMIASYLADDVYAFDPDHAILSYPLFVLNYCAGLNVQGESCFDSAEEYEAAERYCADVNGPIQPLIELRKKLLVQ